MRLRTADGGPLKWLTLVEECPRELLALHVDASVTGTDVRRILARVIGHRGALTRIRSNNGSEFICQALVGWLPSVGADPIPVEAGSPWENGYIESFNSRFRDEFLERVEFESGAGRPRERGIVPSGIQFGSTTQLFGLHDAERVQCVVRQEAEANRGFQLIMKIFSAIPKDSHTRWIKKRGETTRTLKTLLRGRV